MRKIFVKEFDYAGLPDLLRDMANWLDENDGKVWSLVFEPNDQDADEGLEIRWAGYIYCFPHSCRGRSHAAQPEPGVRVEC